MAALYRLTPIRRATPLCHKHANYKQQRRGRLRWDERAGGYVQENSLDVLTPQGRFALGWGLRFALRYKILPTMLRYLKHSTLGMTARRFTGQGTGKRSCCYWA